MMTFSVSGYVFKKEFNEKIGKYCVVIQYRDLHQTSDKSMFRGIIFTEKVYQRYYEHMHKRQAVKITGLIIRGCLYYARTVSVYNDEKKKFVNLEFVKIHADSKARRKREAEETQIAYDAFLREIRGPEEDVEYDEYGDPIK